MAILTVCTNQYITQPAPTSINFIGIVDFTKATVRGLALSLTGSQLSVNSGAAISLPNLVNTTGAGGIGITNPVSGNIQFKVTNTQGTDPRIPTSDTRSGSTRTNVCKDANGGLSTIGGNNEITCGNSYSTLYERGDRGEGI